MTSRFSLLLKTPPYRENIARVSSGLKTPHRILKTRTQLRVFFISFGHDEND